MRAHPVALERPVLVSAGWRAWSWAPRGIVRALESITTTPERGLRLLEHAFPTAPTMRSAATGMIRAAHDAWGTLDSGAELQTAEIDVVGISMGGLVARLAALEPGARQAFGVDASLARLNIRRLFTLATPHRGAKLAGVVALDSAARDMKPGSDFLRRLDKAEADAGGRPYEIVCYARLRDAWVGARNTAPRGAEPIWVSTPGHDLAHMMVSRDQRILLDVARRLRGEAPVAEAGSRPPGD